VSDTQFKPIRQITGRIKSDDPAFEPCEKNGNDLPLTVTVEEAAKILGFSFHQTRTLINSKKIAHIKLGSRAMIPREAIGRYIRENTVEPCRDETLVLASASLTSEIASTSSGQRAVAAASAQRALQICNSLKTLSPSSSTPGPARKAREIHPKSS
jgi:excisionase family DNA binding protein